MSYDIADFYLFYKSDFGQQVQKYTARAIQSLWPDAVDDMVVGYGFTTPYLSFYQDRAQGVFAFMPSTLGALAWPSASDNRVVLTLEDTLPCQDNSVDRLLMIHSLEHSENPLLLLREAWRVVREGGHLLIIVPNRRGFWSRNPATPFGIGRPYSGRQLYALVEKSLFVPFTPFYRLYPPPFALKHLPRLANMTEYVGRSWIRKLGGITIIMAQKQMLSPYLKHSKLRVSTPYVIKNV